MIKIILNKNLLTIYLTLALFGASSSATGNWADEKNWPELTESKKICQTFRQVTPPTQDKPDAKTLVSLKDCDAESLYYGIDHEVDYEAARHCAYTTYEADDPFSGKALLMTIYANGSGVKRDLEVAIALACQLNGAAMEMDERVKHLYKLRQDKWQGNDFSWCDDITSGFAQGQCAMHEARISENRDEAALEKFAAKWSEGAPAKALAKLKDAANHFIELRIEHEVERSGTAQLAMTLDEKNALWQQIHKDLEEVAANKPSCVGAEKITDVDKRLNAAYRSIQQVGADTFKEVWWTVTQNGIKQTQRGWLKYRDAWVAFMATVAPNIPREAVVNWQTLRRVEQLEEFADALPKK
ncbi:MAG: DUF1311 domain-containing protein [Magnetococcales bacterium]|nr:DUF1311 domain-containing protein [Magnetococcales bacterium]